MHLHMQTRPLEHPLSPTSLLFDKDNLSNGDNSTVLKYKRVYP